MKPLTCATALIIILSMTFSCVSFSASVSANHKAADSRYVYKKGFSSVPITGKIKKRIYGTSYRKNSHISLKDLRYINVKHYGYDGKIKTGELIVNKKIAKKVLKIFYALYKKKRKIQRIHLVDDYNANDKKSMAANNTSAFNYRCISGTNTLSRHALGMAIDLDPLVNPYVNRKGVVKPTGGKPYKIRSKKKCNGKYKMYMLHKNSYTVKLFKKYGFSWGGDWKSIKDYQHFEIKR